MFNTATLLEQKTVDGLLITTLTIQLPATADADTTMTTLLVDTMLQADAAREHTVALQL